MKNILLRYGNQVIILLFPGGTLSVVVLIRENLLERTPGNLLKVKPHRDSI